VVGNVGGGELVRSAAEYSRDVDRDIADADHDGPLAVEIEVVIDEVGMAVEPGHELGRGVAAAKVLPRDAQSPVRLRPRREDALVIKALDVRPQKILSVLDVPEEPESRVAGKAVVDGRDVLDLLMVRSDSVAHQPERRRQAIVHVDLDTRLIVRQQGLDGVETGGARADHRNAQRTVLRFRWGHRTFLRPRPTEVSGTPSTAKSTGAHYSETTRRLRQTGPGRASLDPSTTTTPTTRNGRVIFTTLAMAARADLLYIFSTDRVGARNAQVGHVTRGGK
jgi:hypothetical protein